MNDPGDTQCSLDQKLEGIRRKVHIYLRCLVNNVFAVDYADPVEDHFIDLADAWYFAHWLRHHKAHNLLNFIA